MTKRLSPERIVEYQAEWDDPDSPLHGPEGCSWFGELLDHIEAIEAERDNWEIRAKTDMAAAKFWAERAESIQQQRWTVEKELTEAKAEIARLKSILNTMWTQG